MDRSQTDIVENADASIRQQTRPQYGVETVCEPTPENTSALENVSVEDPTAESELEDSGVEGHEIIIMLDTPQDMMKCQRELGYKVGQLLTPITRRTRLLDVFGIDNGAFAKFEEKEFFSLLKREYKFRDLCKFVAVPDVVGSARRTLELFDHFKYRMTGWPLALVMQNGQEGLSIPWKQIDAVFIGGTDKKDGQGDWKLSIHAEEIIKTAKAMGKWVHVGRVNTQQRLDKFEALGVDSVDGTGISRYSGMRRRINHPKLFDQKSCSRKVSNG